MLNILVVFHNLPYARAYTTILFDNLLAILKDKTDVHLTWLIYTPDRVPVSQQEKSNISILDIHDFRDAVKVIQKVKPDIVYAVPGRSPVEYAFALSSRAFNIPLVSGELGYRLFGSPKRSTYIKLFIAQFFQSSLPTDTNQRQFMRRGRSYLNKYLFLIRTQRALKMNKSVITDIFAELKRHFLRTSKIKKVDPKFVCDINFIESEKQIESLVNTGYKRSSLVAVGNPTYDIMFKEVQRFKATIKNSDKINLLLVTTNPNDPGGEWTKEKRDLWIKQTVTELTKYKDEISLVIKIHPSGEILAEYEALIKPIDHNIRVIQHEDVVRLIEESDIVLGTSTSTALVCSLIARKPNIIWNIFCVEGDVFLKRNLAMECKDLACLLPLIRQSLVSNPVSEQQVKEFVDEFLYKSDGCASERIANVILELVKNKNAKYAS